MDRASTELHAEDRRSTLIVGLDEAIGLPPEIVGRKGAGLATLRHAGVPVPPGFVLTTESFRRWSQGGYVIDDRLREAIEHRLDLLQEVVGHPGPRAQPLLVSVRSSPVASMPGLLSSILNVGLNLPWMLDQLRSGEGREFWWELATGFLSSHTEALGDNSTLAGRLHQANVDLRGSTGRIPASVEALLREVLEGRSQLDLVASSVDAVFRSQFKDPAADALAQRGLDRTTPMAVVVQAMAFGNRSEASATGVMWTRDLHTGARPLTGTYVPMAQGPAVVGSRATGVPLALTHMERTWPRVHRELEQIARVIDREFVQVQEVEFTVEDQRVSILQTRDAALSPLASIRYACNRVESGDWSAEEAVRNTRPDARARLTQAATSDRLTTSSTILARGLPASGGAASGPLALRPAGLGSNFEAIASELPQDAIVIAESFAPHEDFELMRKCAGFVSVLGGPGTHTASLLRKLGKPYVVNLDRDIRILSDEGSVHFGNARLNDGEIVTILGDRGELWRGELPTPPEPMSAEQLDRFAAWAERYSTRSSWQVFNYDNNATRAIRDKVAQIVTERRWTSDKALIAELLNLVPSTWRLEQRVLTAGDREAIRHVMLEGLTAGHWLGPKVCRTTEPRLGNGPWQTGLRTAAQVDAFLTDPAYEGGSGHGGYIQWTKDPAVTEIVVVFDPPHKGDSDFEPEHFVCTVSCSAAPPQVQITLMLGTSRLRSLESASPEELIIVTMEPDYQQPRYAGFIRPIFGRNYWAIDGQEGQVSPLQRGEWSLHRLRPLIQGRALSITTEVTRLVLDTLWRPPFDLPHYMVAVEDEFGLDTLEFQGRADAAGGVSMFKVFDAKGHDEQLVANAMATPRG